LIAAAHPPQLIPFTLICVICVLLWPGSRT
jgi:hypothetical protein